jgi:hypothetical protein
MSGSAGHELINKRTFVFGQTDDLSATGESLSVGFANPIDIYKFGYIAETAVVIDAGGFSASLEAEPAGGGTNRVSGATLALVDADDHAQGKVVYTEVIIPVAEAAITGDPGIGGSKRNVGPSGPFHVFPGEQVSVNVTNAGTSGTVRWFIEYAEQPFVAASTVAGTDGASYIKK